MRPRHQALFARDRRPPKPPWLGRLDVVPLDRDVCPDCQRPLRTSHGADALALFWMHGYGAVIRTTHRTCPCGYRRHWLTQTITPKDRHDRTADPRGRMIIRGDARHLPLRDNSVDCIVTSPPYLAQRHYGGEHDIEIGRDTTLHAYVTAIADVFDECRRILKPNGWAWLNIGDKANASGGAGGDWARPGNSRTWQASSQGPGFFRDPEYADQSMLDVPGALVRELIRRRWRLRMPIVWQKEGTREPASMKHLGRPLWSHEMIYALTPERLSDRQPRPPWYPSQLAETGSVWTFKPGGSGDPHLAPFPDELARRCILPTTLPGDTVFDPFSGSGTVPRVAAEMGRRGVGLDLYAGRPDLILAGAATTHKQTRSRAKRAQRQEQPA